MGCSCFGPSTVANEHTATEAGAEHPRGYALYFFTRRAPKLLKLLWRASKRSVE